MRILQKGRRAAEKQSQIGRTALQGIVVHGKQLFIVAFSGEAIGNFIEIYALVDEQKESGIADLMNKQGEKLDVIKPVFIVDHRADAQRRFCFGFRRVFPAEPA